MQMHHSAIQKHAKLYIYHKQKEAKTPTNKHEEKLSQIVPVQMKCKITQKRRYEFFSWTQNMTTFETEKNKQKITKKTKVQTK